MMAFLQATDISICGHKINSLHGRWLTLRQPNLSAFYIGCYLKYVKAPFRERSCLSHTFAKPFENSYKGQKYFLILSNIEITKE